MCMNRCVMWIASLVILVGVVGCVPTDVEMADLHSNVDLLMGTIDDLQVEVDREQAKLTGEIDKVQDHVQTVNDAMKAATTLEEKASAGIEASRPFNPYANEMLAITGVIAAALGYAGRNNKKKYQAHKAGVKKALSTATANGGNIKAEALYNDIGDARAIRGVV